VNELKVLNVIEQHIEWDADAAKSAVTAVIAPYRDLVVTEDNLKDMEKAQKELASMRRKIDKFRKDTKATAEVPIKAFEMEVYAVLKVVGEAEEPLQEQLHKYEVARVNVAEKAIREEANRVAADNGVREQYMFEFSIDPAWTNRTARNGATEKAIVDRVLQIKQKQDLADEAAKMEQLKQTQIKMLCSNLSDKYGLNTPIVAENVYVRTQNAALDELPGIIESAAQQRAEVERRMMEAVMPTPAAVPTPPPETQSTQKSNPARTETYDVVLTLRNLTEAQMLKFKSNTKICGIPYEMEAKDHE
jgi:hypothetical protein